MDIPLEVNDRGFRTLIFICIFSYLAFLILTLYLKYFSIKLCYKLKSDAIKNMHLTSSILIILLFDGLFALFNFKLAVFICYIIPSDENQCIDALTISDPVLIFISLLITLVSFSIMWYVGKNSSANKIKNSSDSDTSRSTTFIDDLRSDRLYDDEAKDQDHIEATELHEQVKAICSSTYKFIGDYHTEVNCWVACEDYSEHMEILCCISSYPEKKQLDQVNSFGQKIFEEKK